MEGVIWRIDDPTFTSIVDNESVVTSHCYLKSIKLFLHLTKIKYPKNFDGDYTAINYTTVYYPNGIGTLFDLFTAIYGHYKNNKINFVQGEIIDKDKVYFHSLSFDIHDEKESNKIKLITGKTLLSNMIIESCRTNCNMVEIINHLTVVENIKLDPDDEVLTNYISEIPSDTVDSILNSLTDVKIN